MTLFTLAGALISASYVCCVAPATSAALHNRFFEGFLQKKRMEREDDNNNNKKKGKTERTNSSTCRRAVPKPTQMDTMAGLFSLPLVSPLFVGFSLFRTN